MGDAVDLSPIARLTRFAKAASHLPDGPWFSAAVEDRLAGRASSLDASLGLLNHGGTSLTHQGLIARRNEMLRQFVDNFLSDVPPEKRAVRLAQELARFSDGLWPRLRSRNDCPSDLIGTRDAALFELFKIGCKLPAQRHLARLII
jgi:hypothetical protein